MNALSIFKTVADLAVSTGVAAIVANASKGVVPANAHIVKKVSIGVGTFILSNMVAEQAVKYTTEKIDWGLNEIKSTKEAFAGAKEQLKSDSEESKNEEK